MQTRENVCLILKIRVNTFNSVQQAIGSRAVIHTARTTGEEMTQKPNFGEILGEDKLKKKKTLEKQLQMSTQLYMKILIGTSHKANVFPVLP